MRFPVFLAGIHVAAECLMTTHRNSGGHILEKGEKEIEGDVGGHFSVVPSSVPCQWEARNISQDQSTGCHTLPATHDRKF